MTTIQLLQSKDQLRSLFVGRKPREYYTEFFTSLRSEDVTHRCPAGKEMFGTCSFCSKVDRRLSTTDVKFEKRLACKAKVDFLYLSDDSLTKNSSFRGYK